MGIEQPSSFLPDRVWKEQGILFPSGVLRWRQISLCFWQIGFLFSITKSPNWKRKPQFKYPPCFCTHCFLSHAGFFTLSSLQSVHEKWVTISPGKNNANHRHSLTGGDRKITDRKQLSPKPHSFPIVSFQKQECQQTNSWPNCGFKKKGAGRAQLRFASLIGFCEMI